MDAETGGVRSFLHFPNSVYALTFSNFEKKIALCGLRWFKLNVSKCQKDVKCQIVKHLDYGGGSQKKNKLT